MSTAISILAAMLTILTYYNYYEFTYNSPWKTSQVEKS